MLTISKLAQIGYAPDANATALPPHGWTTSSNWRFDDGKAFVTQGYQNVFTNRDKTTLDEDGTWLYSWGSSNEPNMFYYDNNNKKIIKIVEVDGVVEEYPDDSDITYSNNVDYLWHGFEYNTIPVFNNTIDTPIIYTGIDSDSEGYRFAFKPLDNFGDNTCAFLTGYLTYMIALGFGDENVIKTSDGITGLGDLPTWDDENVYSQSNLYDISTFSDGALVAALVLNSILIVYTTNDVIAMDYIGGDAVWSFRNLFNDNGLLTAKAVTAIPNAHFVVGVDQVYIHDGNTKKLVGEGIWRKTFFNELDEDRLDELQCIYDSRSNSVFIKLPTGATSQEMWIYNIENNTLGPLKDHQEIKYILFSEEGIPGIKYTIDSLPSEWTYDTIPAETYDELGKFARGQYDQRLLSIGGPPGSNTLFIHDFGNTFNGRTITNTLRRDYMILKEDSYNQIEIYEIIPMIDNNITSGNITIRVGGTRNTTEGVVFGTPYEFNIATDDKADVRVMERYISISFENAPVGLGMDSYQVNFLEIAGR